MAVTFSYKKLWIKLIENDFKKKDLVDNADISSNVLARMNRNEPVSLISLGKICAFLKCDIGDIIEVVGVIKDEK